MGHALDTIVAKANNLLGSLKWACPLSTDVNVRQTLYLFLVKSEVKHPTQLLSPKPKASHTKCPNVVKR